MEELLEALKIFDKYTNTNYPTHCEHDVLYVMADPEDVPEEDRERLEDLGFFYEEGDPYFRSFRFGSA